MKIVTSLFLIVLVIVFSSSAFTQEKSPAHQWIQGNVTSASKTALSIDGVRYELDPLVQVTDLDGSTLTVSSLRSAEMVKAFVVEGKVKKVIILVRRE